MKNSIKVLNLMLLLALVLSLTPVAALAQTEVVCESDVVVQADDWLSKLAEKFYGDPLAFPATTGLTSRTPW